MAEIKPISIISKPKLGHVINAKGTWGIGVTSWNNVIRPIVIIAKNVKHDTFLHLAFNFSPRLSVSENFLF